MMSKWYSGSLTRSLALSAFSAICLLYCVVVAAAEPETTTVVAGTEARLVLAEPLSSETSTTGQKFKLTLDQDIRVAGRIVVARGAEATGTVISAGKAGSMGSSGQLHLRVDYLLVDGRRVPLLAHMGGTGKNHELSAVVITAAFGPLGWLQRGAKVNLSQGTPVLAYVDATTQIAVPPAAPIVPTAAPEPSATSTSPASTPTP
jgi:hypothetical protein